MTVLQPVLDGALAGRARAAALEIGLGLPDAACAGSTLATGKAGIAVALAELGRLLGEERLRTAARAVFEEAAARLAEEDLGPGLWNGFTGVAWAMHRLARLGLVEEGADELDAVVAGALPDWSRGLDVLSGLAGVAAHLAERGTPGVQAAVDRLGAAAEPQSDDAERGLLWRTPASELPAPERAAFPQGCLYLGVAHGTCGMAVALARLASAGIEPGRSGRLARAAATGVLAALRAGSGSVGGAPGPSRGSWCHGEPAMTAALLAVARRLGDDALSSALAPLARAVAARPLPDTGVDDHGGLCHGAASALHLRVRLFEVTGDPALRGSAARWAAHALEVGPPREPGLLTGAAGHALALAGAACGRTDWDWPLFLS